jgi:nicotinic acid mononucleotide adenylyltransferase
MQERSLALFGALAQDAGDRASLEWAEKHAVIVRPLRPLSAPQRDPRPRVDPGGDRVPAAARLELLGRGHSTRRLSGRRYNRSGRCIPILGVFGGTFDPCIAVIWSSPANCARPSALRRSLHPGGDPPHRGRPSPPRRTASPWWSSPSQATGSRSRCARDSRRRAQLYGADARGTARGGSDRTLALIVGADAFLGLPTWHRWREVFALAHVVVVPRPGSRSKPRCRRTRPRVGAALFARCGGADRPPRAR